MTAEEMVNRVDMLVTVDEVDPDSDEYRLALLETIADQADELGQQMDLTVTCPCGRTVPVILAYQCYHCGVHFCRVCAEKHFAGGTDVPIEEIRAAVVAVEGRAEKGKPNMPVYEAGLKDGANGVLVRLDPGPGADREEE